MKPSGQREFAALLRDATRYRFIRTKASRDHEHHTRRAIDCGIVDWGRSIDPDTRSNFWSSSDLTGKTLDKQVDKLMKRNAELMKPSNL